MTEIGLPLVLTECMVMITLSKALNLKFNWVTFFQPDPDHVFVFLPCSV